VLHSLAMLDKEEHGLNVSPSSALSDEMLRAALEAARRRHHELEAQLSALAAERDGVRREAALLEQLMAVRRGEELERGLDSLDGEERSRKPHSIVSEALQELERAARPLHISELMSLLEQRGVRIPGSGQQANLISHLTRDPRIVRPSRGMYALASAGFEEKPKLKPAKKRRVSGQSKAARRTS
jgi:hypothetical protein